LEQDLAKPGCAESPERPVAGRTLAGKNENGTAGVGKGRNFTIYQPKEMGKGCRGKEKKGGKSPSTRYYVGRKKAVAWVRSRGINDQKESKGNPFEENTAEFPCGKSEMQRKDKTKKREKEVKLSALGSQEPSAGKVKPWSAQPFWVHVFVELRHKGICRELGSNPRIAGRAANVLRRGRKKLCGRTKGVTKRLLGS